MLISHNKDEYAVRGGKKVKFWREREGKRERERGKERKKAYNYSYRDTLYIVSPLSE